MRVRIPGIVKPAIAGFFIFLSGHLYAQDLQVKFYLSERDFLSNHPVPLSEVLGQPHYVVEYTPDNKIKLKSIIGKLGEVRERVAYHYNEDGTLKTMEFTDGKNQLFKRIEYGVEEKAKAFISYRYKVDTVALAENRFTTVYFSNQKATRYEFFDVNAVKYGEIGYLYDSGGDLREELWIKHPEKQIIRRWVFEHQATDSITHVVQYDSLGQMVQDVYLSPDGTEAVLSFYWPEDTVFTNRPIVPYRLIKPLAAGRFTWTWTGGNYDSVAVHEYILSGRELGRTGQHFLYPILDRKLVHGAYYDLRFEGRTQDGTEASSVVLSPVYYDARKPELMGSTPEIQSMVTFELKTTEPLQSLSCYLEPETEGFKRAVAYTFDSAASGIRSGSYQIPVVDQLEENVAYRLLAQGRDRSGNKSIQVELGRFIFDTRAPEIAVMKPVSGDVTNDATLIYTLSEDLSYLSLVVKNISAGNIPNTLTIPGIYLLQGEQSFPVTSLLSIADSSYYSFRFQGVDLAGNASDTIGIDSVYFDFTPPVVSVIYPFENAIVNAPAVSYISNEQLAHAILEWTYVLGTEDTVAPYTMELEGEELQPEQKLKKSLPPGTELRDGAKYTIIFRAHDEAGNAIQPIRIENVLYDSQPPEITFLYPTDNMITKEDFISYSSTEYLKEGYLEIVRVGGIPDTQAPYRISLLDAELEAGRHDSIRLSEMPALVSGTIYDFTLGGADLGENQAEPVMVKHVTYDPTPPVMTIEFPSDSSFNGKKMFRYTINEALQTGSVRLVYSSGDSDRFAPHIIALADDQLEPGSHTVVIDNLAINETTRYHLMGLAVDQAGNHSDTVWVKDITYDITPPRLLVSSPVSGSYQTKIAIDYSLSEAVSSLVLTWREKGKSPIQYTLPPENLKPGPHSIVLDDQVSLTPENASYTITFSGADFAGHALIADPLEAIHYDFIPPRVSWLTPGSDVDGNQLTAQYQISEDLLSAAIVMSQIDSLGSLIAMDTIILAPEQLQTGQHTVNIAAQSVKPVAPEMLVNLWVIGRDFAGNVVTSDTVKRYHYDTVRPVIRWLSPTSNSVINHSLVSFELSEDFSQAEIVWEAIDQPGDSETSPLVGSELKAGIHQNILLKNQPNLIDNVTYNLTVTGKDKAGNAALPVTVEHIKYDISRPEIVLTDIGPNTAINSSDLRFTNSEPLRHVEMIWSSRNEKNELEEIQLTFPPSLLTPGTHQLHDELDPGLLDGRQYELTLEYEDLAGNEGETIHLPGLAFDAGPPDITIQFPPDQSIVNRSALEVALSEPVVELTIRITGKDYTSYTETIDSLIESPVFTYSACFPKVPIREGVPYSLSVYAVDKAGNISDTVLVRSIVLDATPPEITIASPAERTRLNDFRLSYIVSEDLVNGSLDVTDSDGTTESLSLNPEQLTAGEHVISSWIPDISDEIPFSVQISGEDPAGHVSQSNKISYLRFDRSRPQVSISEPQSQVVQSSFEIDYSLSENLREGVIIVLNTVEKDSQEIRLTDDQLKQGDHVINRLEDQATLTESQFYDLFLFGMDYAGNPSDTAHVSGIILDKTAPEIVLLYPVSDSAYQNVVVQYHLSEPLADGSVLIVPKKTGSASDSTAIIPLPPDGLTSRDTARMDLGQVYDFQDGGEYQIQITGKDFAGNDAQTAKVLGIRIDTTPPEIQITAPESDRIYATIALRFSFNEDLKEGRIDVLRSAPGSGAATNEIMLESDFLVAGEHEYPDLENILSLEENEALSLQIIGVDYAGNEGRSQPLSGVIFDNSPPVLTLSRPESGSLQSSLTFSLTASEALKALRFVITQTGGVPDPNAPYSFQAREEELDQANWVLHHFKDTPILRDNIPYTIEITATDRGGNQSKAIRVENIKIDATAPEYTLSQPIDGEMIAELSIAYTLSENLANGEVVFTWENGTPDPSPNHTAPLVGESLLQGSHEGVGLDFKTPPVEGGKYAVSLAGIDQAGNELKGQSIHGVLYDATPPVLRLISPEPGAYVKDFMIKYSSSEVLSLARVDVRFSDGSTGAAELGKTSRKSGENFFRLTDYIDVSDGQSLDLVLTGIDLAGNETVSRALEKITLDQTPPECSITAPEDGSHVQRFFLNFVISELLDSLFLTVERSAGNPDPSSPSTAIIPSYLIKPGESSGLDVEDYISLNDGTEYRVTLTGSDRAGNALYPVTVNNVLLDKTPPAITVKFPKPNSYSKKKKFEFEISENLSAATMTWVWTDGQEDPVGVHRKNFPPELLTAGAHTADLLDDIPHVSEAVYNLSIHLVDEAGNVNDINVPNISYDYDAPKLVAITPQSGERIDQVKIKFSCNEKLKIGRITLVDLVSNEAQLYLIPRDKLDAREYEIGAVVGKLSMVDSHIYQIRAFGMDLAGNRNEIVIADSVVFDTKPPVITDIRPRQNGRTNSSAVTFTLNEPCVSGKIIWLRVSGRSDPGSPHVIEIPRQLLKQGQNSTVTLPKVPLVEGAVYSLAISATDLLGNESRQFNVPNITMDLKGPDLIIINPKPQSTSAITAIQIAFSEPLRKARLEIVATGGTPDPNAPYTLDVAENLIKVPREEGVRITGLPALVSGCVYSIELSGIDMAGNPGDVTKVENVTKE